MSSSKRPYRFRWDQNRAVSPRRSAGLSRFLPGRIAQHDLDQVGVEVGDGGGDEVQRQRGDFNVFAVVACQVAGLAVEQVLAGGIEVLHHIQTLVDLPPEFLIHQILTDEDRPDDAAELLDRLVGGVLGAAAGEAAQHLM
ncbi:hypothetical protein GCM10020219_007760 [Nonomuraea dietziae]